MKYILSQNTDGKLLVTRNGQTVPATDILDQFPNQHVFALQGNMGAGKTTFIKQLCEEMGSNDIVNSPTFAIVNVYEDAHGKEIYHFDCYRLKNLNEAMNLGAEDYLYSGNYCFIEWPDVIKDLLPEDTVMLDFEVNPDGTHSVTIDD